MKEADDKQRNENRLAELYPTFRLRVKKVITVLEPGSIRPRMQDAWRSPANQQKAYESGYFKLLFSFHNVITSDGTLEAFAIDLLDDDAPFNPSKNYIQPTDVTVAQAKAGRRPT